MKSGAVLVTGAAGTVGSSLVGLLEAAGRRVIATDRVAAGVRMPVRGEVRIGDLTDATFVEKVVRGAEHVVHTAALLDARASAAELARANTDAVAMLYDAAARVGVAKFIHLSTAMLYAPGQPMPLTEQSEIAPRGPFGLSKHAAEGILRAHGRGQGPAWTILRPAPIYGRRGRHFAASLLALGPMLRFVTPLLPRPRGGPRGTMAHAEDVARAAVFALEHEQTSYEVFNVSDDDPLALGDRVAETFRAYGLRMIPTGRLPDPLLRRFARIFDAPGARETADVWSLATWQLVVVRHGLKQALRPRLDREALTLLYDDLVVDAGKLRGLGWAPRFPKFADGFAEVLRWYQAEGWVPRYA